MQILVTHVTHILSLTNVGRSHFVTPAGAAYTHSVVNE
jgi:hypothetical protein